MIALKSRFPLGLGIALLTGLLLCGSPVQQELFAATIAPCMDSPDGLYGFWALDGSFDASVGSAGSLRGDQVSFGPGLVEQGAVFDNPDSQLFLPVSAENDLMVGRTFSIEAWFRTELVSTPQPLFDWGDGLAGTLGVHLWLSVRSPGSVYANLLDADGGSHVLETGPNVWAPSKFHHVVLTCEQGIDGWAYLFVDGARVGSLEMGVRPLRSHLPFVFVGRRPGLSAFRGIIDEFSLYRRALSGAEVGALYGLGTVGRCRSGPARLWLKVIPDSELPFAGRPNVLRTATSALTEGAYQWFHNGVRIAGATANSLAFNSLTVGDSGEYVVQMMNETGVVAEASTLMNVIDPAKTCIDFADDLLMLFRFESSLDSGPFGDLSLSLGTCSFVDGWSGQGLSFNGVNSVVVVASATTPRLDTPEGFTLSAWMKPDDLVAERSILGWVNGTGLRLSSSTYSDLTAQLVDPAGRIHRLSSPPGALRGGAFHHVALSYDRPQGLAVLYIDGEEVVQKQVGNFDPIQGGDFVLGTTGPTLLFQGVLDDASVFKRALTRTDIQEVFRAATLGFCPTKLVLPTLRDQPRGGSVYLGWPFQLSVAAVGGGPFEFDWLRNGLPIPLATRPVMDLAAVSASDDADYQVVVSNSSGSVTSPAVHLSVDLGPTNCVPFPPGRVVSTTLDGLEAEVLNGVTFESLGVELHAEGEVGQGMVFDGTSNCLRVQTSEVRDWGATAGFTFEGWFKPDDADQAQALFEFGEGVTIGTYLWCSVETPGSLYANLVDAGGQSHPFGTSGGVLTKGVFHHIALTYEKSTGSGIIYLNGREVSRLQLGPILIPMNRPILVGARSKDSGSPGHFKGIVDEVALYNRTLRPDEIRVVAMARRHGKCPNPRLPPDLLLIPKSGIVQAGRGFMFSTSVNSLGTPRLQWFHKDLAIPGATNDTLLLKGVTSGDAGGYFVRVENAFGHVDSPDATLEIAQETADCAVSESGIISWAGFEGDLSSEANGLGMTSQDPLVLIPGKVGLGLRFNGEKPVVSLPTTPLFDVNHGAGFTVEGWILPSDWNRSQPVFEWGHPSALPGPHLWLIGSKRCFVNMTDVIQSSHISTAVVTVPEEHEHEFQHVAWTFDAVTRLMVVYFNGAEILRDSSAGFPLLTERPLFIGHRPSIGGTATFVGDMDEITVYDHPLAAAQIQTIFAAGGRGKCLPSGEPLRIVSQPTDTVVRVGETAFFGFSVSSRDPMAVQWQHSGLDIPGAVGRSLVITNVNPLHAGAYVARVRGLKETLVTEAATLVVMPPTNWVSSHRLGPEFSVDSNPNGPWSYGWKSELSNPLTLYPYSFGAGTEDGGWSGLPGWFPVIHYNATTNTFYAEGHLAVLPPGSVWMFPGIGAPQNYAIVRFTVPLGQGGAYDMGVSVKPYLKGKNAGDAELVLAVNGVDVVRQGLLAGSGSGIQTTLNLNEGDYVEWATGRGSDNDLRASGLIIDGYLAFLDHSPLALSASYTGAEDSRIPISLRTVPSRPSGMQYHIGHPSHGLLTGAPPDLVYVPFPDFNGEDRFTFSVTEGGRASTNGTIVINVTPVNDPPLAVISGTPRMAVYSINGSNAPALLDASRSFDLDGDSLGFMWFLQENLTPLATQAVARVFLPVGRVELALLVDDGALFDLDVLSVRVVGIPEVVASLHKSVASARLGPPQAARLLLGLEQVSEALSTGHIPEAREALISYVSGIPAGLSAEVDAALRNETAGILGWMEATITPGRIDAAFCSEGGCVNLHLKGVPNQSVGLEESSDLRSWRLTKVVMLDSDGSASVEQLPISRQRAAQFFRVAR